MAETTDENLMLLFKNGDAHAFDLLFEKYRGPVFNFLYRMLDGDRESAEDLLQEIFLKVFRGKEFYEPTAKFSTWLFTVARNHCLNLVRSRQYGWAKSTIPLERESRQTGETLLDQLASHEGTEVQENELLRMLDEAIGTLPHKYREAFLLRAVDGFSYQDVGSILGIDPGTARTQVHRAARMLKEKLGPRLDEERQTP